MRQVRALVMGGQACIFYGAAEFSRDLDLTLGLAPDDLRAFQLVHEDLQAQPVAVPAFSAALLEAGHAIHFRCRAPQVEGLRLDVLHTMRGSARLTAFGSAGPPFRRRKAWLWIS
jgi:hypothetical protein